MGQVIEFPPCETEPVDLEECWLCQGTGVLIGFGTVGRPCPAGCPSNDLGVPA